MDNQLDTLTSVNGETQHYILWSSGDCSFSIFPSVVTLYDCVQMATDCLACITQG